MAANLSAGAPRPPPRAPDVMYQPGDEIDIWVVEQALGRGGMGSVYRCHNRAAKRILAAVKVLDGTLKRFPEAEARFVREADILGQLDHPNIVKVRNVRPDADPPYIEMEFAAGESLEDVLRRGSVTFGEALALMRQFADAVAYLHRMGIFHRDIKPANLLVDRDRAKLVDFGLAVEQDASRITQQGVAFGTVSYAPPEWITPERLDPARWDVYGLGVVFWELLTGRVAFPVSGQGTARQQAMQVIVAKQGHPPLDPGDAYHDDVRRLIGEMTRADPDERTISAAAVVERLGALNPEPRRAVGVTLAPPGLGNPFVDTDPPSTLTESAPRLPARRNALSTTPMMTSPPSRVGAVLVATGLVGVAVAVVLGTVAIAAVAAPHKVAPDRFLPASWQAGRDVTVTLDLPADVGDLPVDARLGDAAPTATEGTTSPSPDRPDLPLQLQWAAGPGCTVADCSAGACPAGCATGEQTVEAEVDSLRVAITLPPRAVALRPARPVGREPVVGWLSDAAGERTPEACGPASRRARTRCASRPAPARRRSRRPRASAGLRRPGCTVLQAEVAVAADGQAAADRFDLTVAPDAQRQAPRPVARAPRGSPTPTRSGFFLSAPDYLPGGSAAPAAGTYLKGWTGGSPPAGRETARRWASRRSSRSPTARRAAATCSARWPSRGARR
ncbi:MAG: serine/threonine-protein kinase [Myxococcota bacterium]